MGTPHRSSSSSCSINYWSINQKRKEADEHATEFHTENHLFWRVHSHEKRVIPSPTERSPNATVLCTLEAHRLAHATLHGVRPSQGQRSPAPASGFAPIRRSLYIGPPLPRKIYGQQNNGDDRTQNDISAAGTRTSLVKSQGTRSAMLRPVVPPCGVGGCHEKFCDRPPSTTPAHHERRKIAQIGRFSQVRRIGYLPTPTTQGLLPPLHCAGSCVPCRGSRRSCSLSSA